MATPWNGSCSPARPMECGRLVSSILLSLPRGRCGDRTEAGNHPGSMTSLPSCDGVDPYPGGLG